MMESRNSAWVIFPFYLFPSLKPRQGSSVFEFSEEAGEVVPSLWESLTASGSSDSRWDAITYPVDIHPSLVKGPSALSAQLSITTAAPATQEEEEVLFIHTLLKMYI